MVNSLTNILPKYIWERFSIFPIKIPSKFGALIFWFVMFVQRVYNLYIYIHSRGFFCWKVTTNNLQKEAFWKSSRCCGEKLKGRRGVFLTPHVESKPTKRILSAAVLSLDFSEKCSFKSRICLFPVSVGFFSTTLIPSKSHLINNFLQNICLKLIKTLSLQNIDTLEIYSTGWCRDQEIMTFLGELSRPPNGTPDHGQNHQEP